MHSIKRAFLLVLMGCLILILARSTESRASAQGDPLPCTVEGAFTSIPLTLWEDEDGTDTYYTSKNITAWNLCNALSGVQFHNGDVLYYATFTGEQGELYYRTVDVSTMQVSQVKFPQAFGEENILSSRSGWGYCHVLTDSAVYTFDTKLALVHRTPWPTALRSLMDRWADEQKKDRSEWVWSGWDVNPSGTVIIYKDINSFDLVDWDDPEWKNQSSWDVMEDLTEKDYGNKFIWVCSLQPDAVPQRILPSITLFGYSFTREIYGFPHFIGDDRIFVKNWGWEWSNYWEVWDLSGHRLYNSYVIDRDEYYGFFPQSQVEDAHGLFMHNPGSLMYDSSFYFDYETLQLMRLPLFSHPPYNGTWAFWGIEGRTCTFAMTTRGVSGQADRIDFFRYAFDTQVVESLPLTLHDVILEQAALAPGGRIVFVYENSEGEQHAGVFQHP